jgi:hypothetical protein
MTTRRGTRRVDGRGKGAWDAAVLQPEGPYERLIFWIVKHVPGQYIAVLAGLSYFGLGLGVPFLFLWDPLWWVNANRRDDRRHLLD